MWRRAQAFGFDAGTATHYGGTPLQTAAHSLRRTGTQVKGNPTAPAMPAASREQDEFWCVHPLVQGAP